jgi:hypothetical protein
VNNTILCGARAVFRMFDSLESVEMHNNVFYRIDGNGVQIMRTVEALWTTGAEVIAGEDNWVQTGSTQVPSEWTGTITGGDPGFADLTGGNVRPASGSPLYNTGTDSPSGPPGFSFPSPGFPPAFEPPDGRLIQPGTAVPRVGNGVIDIGAFEYDAASGVAPAEQAPLSFELLQNFPNPFNPSTSIRFRLAERARVILSVDDLSGRELQILLEETMGPGNYSVPWNAAGVASGMYFCRLRISPASGASHSESIRKMLLIR